ncbi:hypothetical protein GO730_34225 [Spirosoma sp. HMF3257]|uniref:Uncharacterized protein n=1 Tax=Spirosoma telluris TaxID=2183553 RepID=A0A327NT50_9BACT|nr:hypothetical protein [Spirosoma telluris]RAI77895.1 hypothetical protein HMF3257_34120 [Spirosoma telluris]
MESSEAKRIAATFLESHGKVLDNFKLKVADNYIEFRKCYYFDYKIVNLDGTTPEEPPLAAGARGVCVEKSSGVVSFITFGGYAVMRREEEEIWETFKLLTSFQKEKTHLPQLKARYNLTSPELLNLSKLLANVELHKNDIMNFVEKVVAAARQK